MLLPFCYQWSSQHCLYFPLGSESAKNTLSLYSWSNMGIKGSVYCMTREYCHCEFTFQIVQLVPFENWQVGPVRLYRHRQSKPIWWMAMKNIDTSFSSGAEFWCWGPVDEFFSLTHSDSSGLWRWSVAIQPLAMGPQMFNFRTTSSCWPCAIINSDYHELHALMSPGCFSIEDTFAQSALA